MAAFSGGGGGGYSGGGVGGFGGFWSIQNDLKNALTNASWPPSYTITTTSTANTQTMPPKKKITYVDFNPKKHNLKVGMKVYLVDEGTSGTIKCIHPEAEQLCIVRDDGLTGGGHGLSWLVSNGSFNIGRIKVAEAAPQKKTNQALKIELEGLILPAEKKQDIIAVLNQTNYSKTIFDDWGMKEVLEYGYGMGMLFYGPPGTGKTYAATCISKDLGLDLLRLTAAELDSAVPGEFERNLIAAFQEAKDENKVLLFDECDSLLYNRNNVGKIIGSEINALLREIEQFEGVVILTTNRLGELDEALERRLSLIMEFPEPDLEGRVAIWNRLLPKKMPLSPDVDVLKMATDFAITGGLIKNVILNAARNAASEKATTVSLDHFKRALKTVARGRLAFEERVSRAPTGYVSSEKVRTS